MSGAIREPSTQMRVSQIEEAMGPTILFDKSAIQGLGQQALVEVGRYFFTVVPHVLLMETLADLSLRTDDISAARAEVAKIANKAHDSVIFERLQAGQVVQGKKLAAARTNREWKPEVENEAKKVFGDRAYTDPELKSPAEIEKLAKGKDFTARWAFKPEGKLTVVSTTDARPAISKDTKSMFEKATKQRKGAK